MQQEWFTVSGGKLSSVMHVETMLTAVRDISQTLLEHVVNMADSNVCTSLLPAYTHSLTHSLTHLSLLPLSPAVLMCSLQRCQLDDSAGHAVLICSLQRCQLDDSAGHAVLICSLQRCQLDDSTGHAVLMCSLQRCQLDDSAGHAVCMTSHTSGPQRFSVVKPVALWPNLQ